MESSNCKRVNVKHELDGTQCWITGLCGLQERVLVACDYYNSCIKIFDLESHELKRLILFKGSRSNPWGVTEIDLKQNSAESSLASGSSSGTDRADPDKPCLVAVTLPLKHEIMFIDVSKKPALRHEVLDTKGPCRAIQFDNCKIYTVCSEVHPSFSLWWSVYIKSRDGETIFDIGIYDYFPGPCLAVVSELVYLTYWDNNKVQCKNGEGKTIKAKKIQGSGPVGICVDPDKNVYVCARRHGTVYKLDADLTQCDSVLDQSNVKMPFALCYYRNKLFISHYSLPSLDNVVTVVRLS